VVQFQHDPLPLPWWYIAAVPEAVRVSPLFDYNIRKIRPIQGATTKARPKVGHCRQGRREPCAGRRNRPVEPALNRTHPI